METTRLSTKGQVVLPKSIRIANSWEPGMEFTVEAREGGILLRPTGTFPVTTLDEVAGSLAYDRKARTPAQMQEAIEEEIRRRNDSGRY